MVNDRIPIKQSLIHPNYDAKHKKFDVALLELESDVTFTDDRQPACLPTRDYEPYTRDRVLKAIGFGTVEPKIMFQDLLSPGHDEELTVAGKCSNRLRETSLIRVPQHRDDCAKGHTLCLNSYNGLSHINVGDSGSPIHLTLNGRTMPYALTVCFRINLNTIHNAFFPSAGRTEAISIYHVLDFIHTYVSPNDLCSF